MESSARRRGSDRDRPGRRNHRPVQLRVQDLLSRMTLAEKVGQMTQAERAPIEPEPQQITELGLGSPLFPFGYGPSDAPGHGGHGHHHHWRHLLLAEVAERLLLAALRQPLFDRGAGTLAHRPSSCR
jgi:hypothetical protein